MLGLRMQESDKFIQFFKVVQYYAMSERDVVVMNQHANSYNDGNGQEEQINVAGKQQIDLEGTEMSKVHNLSDENVARMDEGITDVTGKNELVEHEEKESVDEVRWIVRRISERGDFENSKFLIA